MIICKDGCYAYSGATAAEAFAAYQNSDDDHRSLGPHELEWYSATEMALTMKLKPKPATAKATTSYQVACKYL